MASIIKAGKKRPRKELALRFQKSFGAWTTLSTMMAPLEFLKMQALRKYFYQICISRVQTTLWKRERKLGLLVSVQNPKTRNSLFIKDDHPTSNNWTRIRSKRFDFCKTENAIVVGCSFIVFSKIDKNGPLYILRYTDMTKSLTEMQ